MQRVLLVSALSLLMVTMLPAATRKWTSSDGRYTTEAELVESDDSNVTLKKKSGDIVTVPLERLSELDRHFLSALKKKEAAAKEKKPAAGKENNPASSNEGKAAAKKGNAAGGVSYAKEIQPFLAQYCTECHNKDKTNDGYDVTSYATLIRRGEHGALVVPGRPDVSRLSEVLQGLSKSMPPSGATQPTPEEVAKIAAWIMAGANDDSQAPAGGGKPRGSKRSSR